MRRNWDHSLLIMCHILLYLSCEIWNNLCIILVYVSIIGIEAQVIVDQDQDLELVPIETE